MAEEKYGKKLISWNFPEFIKYERSRGWYVIALIIGGLLLLYAVVTVNFLFALIVIIVAVILFLKTSEEANNIEFTIYEAGIKVGEKFYEYKELKNFYLIYEPPEVKSLYLDFQSSLRPRLQIPLEDKNPVKVREILLDYLNEDLDKENEPISDGLGRILKL